jgi:hypothetical protein
MAPPRIAILGAGPIGLEAALYAATLRLPVTVYERGRVAEHVRQWGHVRLFSPFGMNSTPLGRARIQADHPGHDLPDDGDCLTGREHADVYLDPLAQGPLLAGAIRAETTVLYVGRRGLHKEETPTSGRAQQPFRLLLRHGHRELVEEADVVVDCTGTYGQPRFLGDGGIPAAGELAARPHICGSLDDILGEKRSVYADKTTLVVGGGYSAATTVCSLSALAAKHPGTWIIWLARGAGSQPLRRQLNDPLRERDQLAVRANNLATRGEGHVEFHPQTVVESIDQSGPDRPFQVTGRCGKKTTTWEVDRIVANVGFSPHAELYRELQVEERHASPGPVALRSGEPNFYVLGAKSYGRNSNFLLKNGLEQVREVFALITGRADLDLYRRPL